MSYSLRPHGLQYARLFCPSPSPIVCSNSCPLCQWCHPTFSSSVILSCLQSFPESRSFPVSQLFASGGQNIGASASVLPMNIQGWFPLGLTGWISLQSKGLSRVFSSSTIQKYQFFGTQLALWSNSHIHTWLLEKSLLWLYRSLLAKWYLFFNMLSRFVIAFLPRSKHLLISWLQSPPAVVSEPKKRKFVTASTFPPKIMGLEAIILVFSNVEFQTSFFTPLSFSRGSLVPLHFLPLGRCHLHIWGCWYFSWQSWFQLVIHPAQHFTWCTLHVS